MRDRDPVVRELACSIVVQTMPERPDEALAALLVAAKDSDPAVRRNAVTQLEQFIGRYGSSAESVLADRAIRALGEALGDDSRTVRLSGGFQPLALGPKARSVGQGSWIEPSTNPTRRCASGRRMPCCVLTPTERAPG